MQKIGISLIDSLNIELYLIVFCSNPVSHFRAIDTKNKRGFFDRFNKKILIIFKTRTNKILLHFNHDGLILFDSRKCNLQNVIFPHL